MANANYDALARRLETHQSLTRSDFQLVMGLLGYIVSDNRRMRFRLSCRKPGGSHGQGLPDFRSADDAAMWIKAEYGNFYEIGKRPSGEWKCVFDRFNNGRSASGRSRTLGSAMWAAFVRSHHKEP